MKAIRLTRLFQNYYDDTPPGDKAPPTPPPGDKTYTQKQLDDIVAAEKTQSRRNTEALIKQLEELKNVKGTSDEQIATLNQKIEELHTQTLSKEELAKRDKEKLQKEYESKLTLAQEGEKTWRSRFTDNVMEVEIVRESEKAKAYRSPQILALLKPMSKVVEVLDENQKATGTFQTRISFPTKDEKAGTIKILDLSVADAIKMMKEQDDYANMFIDEGTGGVGGGQNRGDGPVIPKKTADLLKMSDEQYREHRKRHPNLI